MGKTYIIPSVKINGVSKELLNTALNNFLNHPTQRVLLIKGPSGIGKSACLEHIKGYAFERNIPAIYIALNIYSEADIKNGMIQPISSKLNAEGWNKEDSKKTISDLIQILLRSRVRLLLMDGQDELKQRTGLVNIYQTNKLSEWKNLKVIITCQQAILPSIYQQFFALDERNLLEWQLLPLTKEQQQAYIKTLINEPTSEFAHLSLERCQAVLEKLPLELTGNPLLLSLYLIGIPSLPKAVTLQTTYYQIYQAALTEHFKREEMRRGTSPVELQENITSCRVLYAHEMALTMWINGSKTLRSKDWRLDLFPESTKLFAVKKPDNKAELTPEENNHCLLVAQGSEENEVYQFKHASIQEYLVANWLINYLQNHCFQENPDFKSLNQTLSTYQISPTILLSDENILIFLSEALNADEGKPLKSLLYQMIIATQHPNESLAPLGAFAITLLNYVGENFSHRDFQGIHISGAILRFSCFYGTQLQGSDLSRVNFQGADLTRANLQDCLMEQVQFGELPKSQVEKGEYQFSRDLKQLLIGTLQGEIQVFNLITNQVENTYQPEKSKFNKSQINQLCWDSEEKIILSLHNNGKAYLIDQKKQPIMPLIIPLIDTPFRYIKSIALAVHSSKTLIAVAYSKGLIQLLHHENEQFLFIRSVSHTSDVISYFDNIEDIALNLDGHLTVKINRKIWFYHFSKKNWQLKKNYDYPYNSHEIRSTFNNDGKIFFSTYYCLIRSSNIIHLWDIHTGEIIKTFSGKLLGRIISLCYNPPFLIAGDSEGNLFMWHHFNSANPFAQIDISTHAIQTLQFNAKDNLIVSIDKSGEITRTEYQFSQRLNYRQIPALNNYNYRTEMVFSPDGNYLLVRNNLKTLLFYETNEWKLINQIKMDLTVIYYLAITNKAKIRLISLAQKDENIFYFILINKKEYWIPDNLGKSPYLITDDKKYVIYCDKNNNITSWHLEEKKIFWASKLFSEDPKNFHCFNSFTPYAFCPNSVVFAQNMSSHAILNLINIENGKIIQEYTFNGELRKILIARTDNVMVIRDKNGYIYLINCTPPFKEPIKMSELVFRDIAINGEATLIIGVSASKPVILIWQRKGEILKEISSFLYPDIPYQVFLYETQNTLKIISRSFEGNVRCWESPNKIPYGFKLVSENSHFLLSLKEAQIESIKGLSAENIQLLQQRGAKGSPNSNLQGNNTMLTKTELLLNHPGIVFITELNTFSLMLKQEVKAIIANPTDYGLQVNGLTHVLLQGYEAQKNESVLLREIITLGDLNPFMDERISKEHSTCNGFGVLHFNALGNYSAITEHLIKEGFRGQLLYKDSLGFNPMQLASFLGRREFFRVRFDKKPEFSVIRGTFFDQDKQVEVHLNELHLALMTQQVEIVSDIFSKLKENNQKIKTEIKGLGNVLHLLVYISQYISTQRALDKEQGTMQLHPRLMR